MLFVPSPLWGFFSLNLIVDLLKQEETVGCVFGRGARRGASPWGRKAAACARSVCAPSVCPGAGVG